LTQEGARPPGLAEIQVQEQSDHLPHNYLANKNEDSEKLSCNLLLYKKMLYFPLQYPDNYFDLDQSEDEE